MRLKVPVRVADKSDVTAGVHCERSLRSRTKPVKSTSLAFVVSSCFGALLGCSAPQQPVDGRPVAISPQTNSSLDSINKSTPVPEPSKSPTPQGATLSLELLAKGTFDGRYVQERCADGLRQSTTVDKTQITRTSEFFEMGGCEVKTKTEELVFKVTAAKAFDIDLEAQESWVTLHKASEVELADDEDKSTFRCAKGWKLDERRSVSALGDCKLEAPTFTRLAVEKDALRWGASSQSDKGELLDGTTAPKRHRELEKLPYVKTK